MADLFDYLHWRGDLSFSQVPPGPVDALIFSALSYISFTGSPEELPDIPISLRDASEEFFQGCGQEDRCRVKADLKLLAAAAETERFGRTLLLQYRDVLIPEEDTQFAAISFLLDSNSAFLAFRGTDYSLTGWKEDFNMSFQESVPAQRLAAEYVRDFTERYPIPMYLGGHSKGGNLAVYAAVFAPDEIKERIITAYSNDGPGFVEEIVSSPEFKKMESKIHTIVPQSSVIGMLLEHKEDYTVIESSFSGGFFQHDPFSWHVLGNSFVHLGELDAKGKKHDRVINEWLRRSSPEERRRFTETLFGVLESTGAKTLSDLSVDTLGKIRDAVKAYSGLDKESKEHLVLLIRRLAEVNFGVKPSQKSSSKA